MGALVQLGLMAGLPTENLSRHERASLLVLGSLFALSLIIVIVLRRLPKVSIVLLAVVSIFGLWSVGRGLNTFLALPASARAPLRPAAVCSFVLASFAIYSFPIALWLAWSLFPMSHN